MGPHFSGNRVALPRQLVSPPLAVPQAGLEQFPRCPYLRIVYSSFLIDCRKQRIGGSAQLDLARKMHPNLSYM